MQGGDMANKRAIEDLLTLLARGYAPYRGEVEGCVYARLRCPRPEKAAWFTRGEQHVCLGCGKRCSQSHGEGFQLILPGVRRGFQVAFATLPSISARELAEKKALLNVAETAFALGVSRSQVYQMIAEGKLTRHVDEPVRVTSESVLAEMGRVVE
jgi:hypothetical protein